MPEIHGCVTITPASKTILMSVAEEFMLMFLIGGVILLAMRIQQWQIQKKIDAVDARLRSGMTNE